MTKDSSHPARPCELNPPLLPPPAPEHEDGDDGEERLCEGDGEEDSADRALVSANG